MTAEDSANSGKSMNAVMYWRAGRHATRWLGACALATILLPQAAGAEILDLGTKTCKEFLTSSKENIASTLA